MTSDRDIDERIAAQEAPTLPPSPPDEPPEHWAPPKKGRKMTNKEVVQQLIRTVADHIVASEDLSQALLDVMYRAYTARHATRAPVVQRHALSDALPDGYFEAHRYP